jgi:MarR family transcriptional regulator, organic hydroperoxide resistance regulator
MTASLSRDDRLTLDQQVCFTLSVAAREVVSLYRPLLEPLGLTHPQYLVMVALWGADGHVSIKQLSKQLRLEAPTLSPLLKRLQSAGLVKRQRDPADERSLQVSVTDQGWELRDRAAKIPAAIIARLGIPVEELESLQDALAEVIEHAKTRDAPPAPAVDLSLDGEL